MGVQIINPFMQSAKNVLEQMTSIPAVPGTISPSHTELHDSHLWILIDLKGEVDGSVAFGFVPDTALKIASAMMGGFHLEQLDALSQSAISELANMISGNACSLLSQEGVTVDISPPRLVFGESVNAQKSTAVAVPLSLQEMGVMEVKLLIA
ncbi:chemotaxis protein CheX [Effusibacillus consociatus]|uniref:Chemotaxis protein CheX n=1 Tax=Effusibacillus consociatus TaxID=1117041 RepID=A0ABV9Q4C1_9BACL